MGHWDLHSHEGLWRQEGGACPSSLAAYITSEKPAVVGRAQALSIVLVGVVLS